MIEKRESKRLGTRWFVRVPDGKGGKQTLGTFASKDAALKAEAKWTLDRRAPKTDEACDEFALRWPEEYTVVKSGPTRGRKKNETTLARYRECLKPFIAEFRGVKLGELTRSQARSFAVRYPRAATVARNMFADAYDDEIVEANPFRGLNLEQRSRKDVRVLSESELRGLADRALRIFGSEYGPMVAGMILAAAYTGTRLGELLNLEWRDINLKDAEVHVREAKFDKPRTICLLPEAREAFEMVPRRIDRPQVFYSKLSRPLSKSNHWHLWDTVRKAEGLNGLDWHELRHYCAHHIYIRLGLGSELAAFQLGHTTPRLVEELYGHPTQGALERLKVGTNRPSVVRLDGTFPSHVDGRIQ